MHLLITSLTQIAPKTLHYSMSRWLAIRIQFRVLTPFAFNVKYSALVQGNNKCNRHATKRK